jgi:prephenate dehydrogenase
MIETLGIIGYGSFGSFIQELAQQYTPNIQVKISSSRFTPDGKTFFSFEEVCACDVLIPAVPISTFREALARIKLHLGSNTIIVDVATVKMHTVQALRELDGHTQYVATHPMFGPYSYIKKGKSIDGLRIVITEHTLSSEQRQKVRDFLESIGLVILETTAQEHDQILAETLFLTHYIAQVVTYGNFIRTNIDTVSFGFLMDAVESVQNDTELFKDVYTYNPYCKEVIARSEQAEQAVEQLLSTLPETWHARKER